MSFVLQSAVSALALWLASELLPGRLTLLSDGSTTGIIISALVVGAILGIVNAIIRPIIKVASVPLYILTLGLWSLVISPLMLWITAWISQRAIFGGHIGISLHGGILTYFLVALVLAILHAVINWFTRPALDGAGAPRLRR